jgi:hypothetical protein
MHDEEECGAIPRVTMPARLRRAVATAALPTLVDLCDEAVQRLTVERLRAQVSGLGEFVDGATRLCERHGGMIIENYPVDTDPAVVALAACFGRVDPLGNGIPPSLVFDVVPRRDEHGNVSMAGSSRGAGYFDLHNDSASFEDQHSHIVLACVRAHAGCGGESLAVRAETIAARLLQRGAAESVVALADPVFPFIGSGCDSASDVVIAPILYQDHAGWQVRYTQQCIVNGRKYQEIDDKHARALGDFESVLSTPGLAHEFALLPGQVWVLRNRSWLHGRRAIDVRADRLLKRCKVYASD